MKTLTAKELKKGKISIWETFDKDDHRIAEISFNKKTGLFLIWFNGGYVWGGKTFSALTKRFDLLKSKWQLIYYDQQ